MNDSVEKIIDRYFSAVTTEDFTYNNKEYKVYPLKVSPGIFTHQMTCVANCGACCFRFSLDWLPEEFKDLSEIQKEHITPRPVEFNQKMFSVFSDMQHDNTDHYCRNLRKSNGRCGIHGSHPFSCDFELLRFKSSIDKNGKKENWLGHTPFGRGWNLTKIDGEKGAICEWYDARCTDEWKSEIIRKLLRLKDWTDYFQIQTVIPNIVKWVRTGPHQSTLVLNQKKKGFGL